MTDKKSPYYLKLSHIQLKILITEMYTDGKNNLPELGGVSGRCEKSLSFQIQKGSDWLRHRCFELFQAEFNIFNHQLENHSQRAFLELSS